MYVIINRWDTDKHRRLYVKLDSADHGYDVELGYFDIKTAEFVSKVNFDCKTIVDMITASIRATANKDSGKELDFAEALIWAQTYLSVKIELTNEQFIAIKHADSKEENV
jgi:hypothetical protein